MNDAPGPVRQGEELDVSRLEAYLDRHLPDVSRPLEIQQFPSGFSNLTYLLKFGEREFVLRRPPFGNPVKSAHDMGREYRVLSKLCDVYEPAPRPYVYCQDTSVIGDEFYVMQRRHGVILRKEIGEDLAQLTEDSECTGRLSEAFVDNLARLHGLDYQSAGLADLGKPEGYVERQVGGWIKRYNKAKTDDVAEIDRLMTWLDVNRPPDHPAALIHNDYKYDNLMLDPDDLTRIVAVLDWEMATIGDPLMDLGTTLAYWVESTDSPAQLERAFGPTMLPGSMTREQLVERYAEQVDSRIPDMMFYYCFGLFKLAVIVQQIYARYDRGLTQDDRFANLNRMVHSLGVTGVETIASGQL